ncbi:hypothetical protein [Paraburkholderia sp. BL6665CI2N2]|uniref:hypothetical protein n=1 Tax=Paraburkholderia sp. BL6665CI2N2 TaxID=1938806 RepID=UPI00141707EE|nr:hypothetical protein [Paraburkholderia sp. BL6665CI2N2]
MSLVNKIKAFEGVFVVLDVSCIDEMDSDQVRFNVDPARSMLTFVVLSRFGGKKEWRFP